MQLLHETLLLHPQATQLHRPGWADYPGFRQNYLAHWNNGQIIDHTDLHNLSTTYCVAVDMSGRSLAVLR